MKGKILQKVFAYFGKRKDTPAPDNSAQVHADEQADIDTSMFDPKELADIQNGVDEFLLKLKKQDSTTIHSKLLQPSRKRLIFLPISILLFSVISLLVFAGIYLDKVEPQETNWITRLFNIRNPYESPSDFSRATQKLIASVRDANEARIVGLFVDLINFENAERSPNEQSQRISSKKTVIAQQIAKLQNAFRINFSQVLTPNTESTKIEFKRLAEQYERTNLQADQYASLVSRTSTELNNNNFEQASLSLSQLEDFLNNSVIQENQSLKDITKTGPAFIESVKLYLVTVQELENIKQVREGLGAAGSQSDLNLANQQLIEELNDSRTRVGLLEKDNDRLETVASDLSQYNQQLKSRATELTLQVGELSEEINRMRIDRQNR